MNKLLRPKRLPFPLVVNPHATRLPRGSSYSDERDAGRCLIALTFESQRGRKWVIIRNCHRGDEGIVVENMREFIPGRVKGRDRFRRKAIYRFAQSQKPKIATDGMSLARLKRIGIVPYKSPFMLADPYHNSLLEMPARLFDELWKTHVVAKPSLTEKYYAAPDETPMLRLFRLHWRERQVRENWTAERIKRLCLLWQLTPHELAELIQWSPGGMNTVLANTATIAGNILPGPVALWFYFLENTKLGIDVFPSLPQTEAQAS